MAKSSLEILKETNKAREVALQAIDADPYIGFKTLDETFAGYQCNSQAEVLARLLNRENLFISGPAGSGKSFILNRFISLIDAQFAGKFSVAVTASTGIAATIIGGSTIHSWAGLGIDTEPFDSKKASPMVKSKVSIMRTTDVLIIDEISMLPAYLFTKLDLILKWARRSDKPFGGIQIVLTGDFLQLPPVSRSTDTVDTGFAIKTDAWKEANIQYCYMDKTHRATDSRLKYILQKVSTGKALDDPKVKQLIDSRRGARAELCDDDKVYSTLFTVNKNVDDYNQQELAKNTNRLLSIPIETEGSKADIEKIIKKYAVPMTVDYKVGATVMLSSNIRLGNGDTLANGSIGQVTGVISGEPMVKFNDGTHTLIRRLEYPLREKRSYKTHGGEVINYEETVAVVKQIPLKLGYAITVHKSQGQTFNGVVADLSKVFTPGLGYVALSRVRTIDDLVITGWNPKALELDPLSKKISNFVKKKGLASRADFMARRDEYEGLLTDPLVRTVMWQEVESAKINGARKDWVF